MATAPIFLSRRLTLTRKYAGFGGIWWMRRTHRAGDSRVLLLFPCCPMHRVLEQLYHYVNCLLRLHHGPVQIDDGHLQTATSSSYDARSGPSVARSHGFDREVVVPGGCGTRARSRSLYATIGTGRRDPRPDPGFARGHRRPTRRTAR